jgi:hypothetical protein
MTDLGSDQPETPAPRTAPADPTVGIRKLPVAVFIGIAAVYLVIVQGLAQLLTAGLEVAYAAPTDLNTLWRSLTVPVVVSLVFVYAVVAVLGWWRPVWVDHKPVRRWVRILPMTMVITVLAGTNYAGLADKGAGFAALLLLTTLAVGFAEEGMFRGLGVTSFRVNGFPEARVALWSSVVFGLAHATNLISEGPKAFVQVLATAVAGYLFYLIRRSSGGLLVPAVVHGLWDFGLISGSVVAGKSYVGSGLFILADLVLLIIVLVRRHQFEPEPARP